MSDMPQKAVPAKTDLFTFVVCQWLLVSLLKKLSIGSEKCLVTVYVSGEFLQIQSHILISSLKIHSSNITSGILYNQFLINRDSCSGIVDYFYDIAPGRIYKNWQG